MTVVLPLRLQLLAAIAAQQAHVRLGPRAFFLHSIARCHLA
jgi:hypothetical protein